MVAKVVIVGATTWGTALGINLARKQVDVCLLTRTPEEAHLLTADGQHNRFLPGIKFPESLTVSGVPDEVVPQADLIIIVVPSDRLRQNVLRIKGYISPGSLVVSASKGLELPGGKRMSQVLEEELPDHLHPGICALSGPNFAKEIVQGKPASTVVAGKDADKVEQAQAILMTSTFRVYTSDDLIGVELGGALKNIIALGAGIADGMNMGDNGKAAFVTRGLAEIARLGVAAGANPLTFAGLAGMGDLFATCVSPLSRNRYVGEQLAAGRSWPEIRKSMDNVVEGVNTTGAALAMAAQLGVEMPITQVTYRVLFEGLSTQEAVAELMERPPRSEL